MPGTPETLHRYWVMLRAIPREPRSRTTQEICSALAAEGFDVSSRTVTRDLDKLSALFGYVSFEEGRAYRWQFPRHTRPFDIPGMEPTVALAWMMSERMLASSVPPTTYSHLQPYFMQAQGLLNDDAAARNPIVKWADLFRVAHRGPRLREAEVDTTVHDTIANALLRQRQVRISYQGRQSDQPETRIVNPYGLVLSQGVLYLVGSAGDYTDPVHFALHRTASAEMNETPANRPAEFDIDEYVEHSFAYARSGEKLRLVARFSPSAAFHLRERPLSDDQVIQQHEDHALVSATVADSDELLWWILGFGDQVEVLEPGQIRERIASAVRNLAKAYLTPGTTKTSNGT